MPGEDLPEQRSGREERVYTHNFSEHSHASHTHPLQTISCLESPGEIRTSQGPWVESERRLHRFWHACLCRESGYIRIYIYIYTSHAHTVCGCSKKYECVHKHTYMYMIVAMSVALAQICSCLAFLNIPFPSAALSYIYVYVCIYIHICFFPVSLSLSLSPGFDLSFSQCMSAPIDLIYRNYNTICRYVFVLPFFSLSILVACTAAGSRFSARNASERQNHGRCIFGVVRRRRRTRRKGKRTGPGSGSRGERKVQRHEGKTPGCRRR